jgi:transposase-like protein
MEAHCQGSTGMLYRTGCTRLTARMGEGGYAESQEYTERGASMPRGQKTTFVIQLDADTRTRLTGWLRRPRTPMGLAKRAQAILLLDQGESFAATARRIGLSEHHTRKWAYRFIAQGVSGLLSRQRSERLPPAPRRQKAQKNCKD